MHIRPSILVENTMLDYIWNHFIETIKKEQEGFKPYQKQAPSKSFESHESQPVIRTVWCWISIRKLYCIRHAQFMTKLK